MKFRRIIIALVLSSLFICFGCMHAEKSYNNAVINYEEYQEIYNTCIKLNKDLCNQDKLSNISGGFSKEERKQAIRANLDRWIGEYNAKSKMLNRSIWKSSELPYQLSSEQFNCY